MGETFTVELPQSKIKVATPATFEEIKSRLRIVAENLKLTKNQMETLEVKNTTSELKNLVGKYTSILYKAEEKNQ